MESYGMDIMRQYTVFPEFQSMQISVFTRHCRRNTRPDSWPLGIYSLVRFVPVDTEVFVMW